MDVSAEARTFLTIAATLVQSLEPSIPRATRDGRFKRLFGVRPCICGRVWLLVESALPTGAGHRHLLWTLYFLKHYAKEAVNAAFARCDEKTYRKWCWMVMRAIADLDVVSCVWLVVSCLRLLLPISLCLCHVCIACRLLFLLYFTCSTTKIVWEDRYEKDNGSKCLVSVDGTDFQIREPSPFNRKWFSHKMNGPGLRYEVAVCIQTGIPVWTNGPYPCGTWPDLKIARHALVDALDPGERYIADGGYRDGNKHSVTPTGRNNFSDRQKAVVRARHETYNKRLKDWGALKQQYRHKLELHTIVFRSIANILQVGIRNGEPLFQLEYND